MNASGGSVSILFDDRAWTLVPGDELTFGRAAGLDARIGHAPVDALVSRRAGSIECHSDLALIHNHSSKRSLFMRTFPGPEFEIAPHMTMGTSPHDRVRVVVEGEHRHYSFDVTVRGMNRSGSTAEGMVTVGYDRIDDITRSERRYLAALCVRLMTQSGPRARALTYAEIQAVLAESGSQVSVRTVRNTLERLRHRLAGAHDIRGLQRGISGDEEAGANDFRSALALWAIRSGNVTSDDLDEL